ncbi:DNA-3-methyladenine glycosylase [Paenibacillus popilliae]|nr:DNA-3-methyladenine glycosylase [Paenibacillus popilliae]
MEREEDIRSQAEAEHGGHTIFRPLEPGERLSRLLYWMDAVSLARTLLGTVLVRRTAAGIIRSRIVETEAYVGPEDKGCHAYGGLRTARTEPMFADGGTSYVYFIYGMYHCLNVVAEQKDKPEAVLIRAVAPCTAEDEVKMRSFRAIRSRKPADLCNGPGKLCMALNIDKRCNALDLTVSEEMWLEAGAYPGVDRIVAAPRINIPYAEEFTDKLWRYYIQGDPYVSVVAKEAVPLLKAMQR